MNLQGKFQQALDVFVERQKKNPNVIGIIVSGSFLHSLPDKNSDLDVYVVLASSKMRERGNTWINGVEVEYFINPVDQIEYYLETELNEKSPATAHMFAHCNVLYEKGPELNRLISYAKKIVHKKMNKMTSPQVELAKYFIDDLHKDLEDTYLKKDWFAFSQVRFEIQQTLLTLFFDICRIPQTKSKRLEEQLKELDPLFFKKYIHVIDASSRKEQYDTSKKLIAYIEKLLGGKRPREWRLRSKCVNK